MFKEVLQLDLRGELSSCSLALPLAHDAVLLPVVIEDLADEQLVEMATEVREGHPPGAVLLLVLLGEVDLVLQGLVLVPLFTIVREGPVPPSFLAPRVPDLDQL